MLTRTTPAIKNNTGPAENLFIDDIPKPAPAAGEALIKVKAFGLNRMDLLQREGKYPVPPQAPPTMGVEFSGVIEGFGDGSNVGDFKVGGEVLGLAYGGAYAEYIVVALAMLVHKPKELSWEEAAGVPEVSIGYAAEDRAIADVCVCTVDMDYRLASPFPHWRFPTWPIRPLARRCLFRLAIGHPTRQGPRRKSHLRDGRFAREDRFPDS